MNNCLVTKLKGSVQNDNLPIYGAIEFVKVSDEPYASTVSYQIGLGKGAESGIVKISSKNLTQVRSRENGTLNLPATLTTFYSGDDTNWLIWDGIGNSIFIDKYSDITKIVAKGNAIKLANWCKDIKNLQYLTSLKVLSIPNTNIEGNISALSGISSLETIDLPNTNIEGNISALSSMSGLTLIYMANTNVEGNISALSSMSGLTRLNLQNTKVEGDISSIGHITSLLYIDFVRVNLTGSVEAFVAAQVNAGRASVTESDNFSVNGMLYVITFGGSTRVGGYQYLTWESANKIGVLQGSRAGIANTTSVYTKGYTQKEAEAKWPGKTIIRVDA